MDEIRAIFAGYKAGVPMPTMPDQPGPGINRRGENWVLNLNMAEARALDHACSEGARGTARATFTSRQGGVGLGDVMTAVPATEEAARTVRAMLDERATYAQLRDVTRVRRQVAADAAREELARVAQIASGERAFQDRVQAEVERRLKNMERD